MAGNRRLAAGGTIAVAGGGAARVISHSADEAAHVRPVHVDPLPRPPDPGGGVVVPGGAVPASEAAERLRSQADSDEDVKAVMCAAFSYFDEFGYDPDDAPPFDAFATWAVGELDQTPRHKAEEVYDDVTDLSSGDVTQLSGLYCDLEG
jgi:hypothetical protein